MANFVKEVVVSLSRNISEYPFVNRLDKETKSDISSKIETNLKSFDEKFTLYDLEKIDKFNVVELCDEFYISSIDVDNASNISILVNEKRDIAIVTNLEDHIRIIAKSNEFDLEGTYQKADRVDDFLSEKMSFAFSKQYGYLSPNISNIGTAMNASVILFLGALNKNKSVARIASNLSNLGLVLKPVYSDGIHSYGSIYSLSNSVTMGITENAAIDNLKNISEQLISQEGSSLESFVKRIDNVDMIFRSLGILQNARVVSYKEALELLSNIRLGIEAKIISIDISTIDKLISEVQPSSVANKFNDEDFDQINIRRASIIREALDRTTSV